MFAFKDNAEFHDNDSNDTSTQELYCKCYLNQNISKRGHSLIRSVNAVEIVGKTLRIFWFKKIWNPKVISKSDLEQTALKFIAMCVSLSGSLEKLHQINSTLFCFQETSSWGA